MKHTPNARWSRRALPLASTVRGSSSERVIGRGPMIGVAASSLFNALTGYIVLALAARGLSVESNTVFVTFWSLLYFGFAALYGLNQESARSRVLTDSNALTPDRGQTTRPLIVSLGIAAALVLIGAISVPWWAPLVFHTDAHVTAVLCMSVLAGWFLYATYASLQGLISGRKLWSASALLLTSESLIRLLLVVGVVAAGLGLSAFALASSFPVAIWLAFLASGRIRSAVFTPVSVRPSVFSRRSLAAMLAQSASALLVVGFPVLLAATTSADSYAAAAPTLLAITLTRAPIMVPLNAFQSVLIVKFTAQSAHPARALLPMFGGMAILGVVGAFAGAFVGPPLMVFLFGDSYLVSGQLIAGLVVGASSLGLITISGAFCHASGRTRAYVAGWLLSALAASAVLLLMDGSVGVRAVVALIAGPALGLFFHCTACFKH